MPATEVKAPAWTCQHCGYTWLRRKELEPLHCPKCRRTRP